MKTTRFMRRSALIAVLGGGLMFGNGCLNTLLSVQFCGTVLPTTVCTPEDQLLLVWEFLQVPDFDVDPSCTIPYSCGDTDFPFGGGPVTAPQQGGGGGGGGFGGIGGGGGGGGI